MMIISSIIPAFLRIPQRFQQKPLLLARHPPRAIHRYPTAMRYWRLLSPLNWQGLPQRPTSPHQYQPTIPYSAFLAACLIKLDQQLVSMGKLCQYLDEHPRLQSTLGFPAPGNLPTARHFTRMLRSIPNSLPQLLLDDTVRLLQAEARDLNIPFGQIISLDTKHILAWVKENNNKAYSNHSRFDKHQQPKGDLHYRTLFCDLKNKAN